MKALNLLAAVALSLGPSPALAGQVAAGAPAKAPDWTSPNYKTCGQDCLYRKGNESLSFEALYVMEKMDVLREIVEDSDSSNDKQVFDNLKHFCTPTEVKDGSSKSAETCFKRWELAQLQALRSMRSSIGRNKYSSALLKTDQKAIAKPFEERARMDAKKASKLQNHLPEVMSYDEAKKLLAKGSSLEQTITQNYQQWLKDIPREPARDDFILFKSIPRDPNDPQSEELLVVEMEADGVTPKVDEQAFQQALATYRQEIQKYEPQYQEMAQSQQEIQKRKTVLAPRETENAFKAARNILVDTANRAIHGSNFQSVSQVQFQGNNSVQSGPGAASEAVQATRQNAVVVEREIAAQPKVANGGGSSRDVYVSYEPRDLEKDIQSEAKEALSP